jgi:EmrB/QacA subfamily drug resistance transporter
VARSEVGLRSERGPVLLAGMLATFLVAIDATILATAVPSVVEDLGGFEAFPWLFSAYLLTQTVLVPVYSKLADMIGRKPILLFGITVFVVGSILCAIAPTMLLLIVFRAVQGIGAGAILPGVMTIVGDLYSVEERARIQGYLASVWAISSVAGPTLGGLFSQFVGWPWIFWINLPLGLVAAWLLVRGFREKVERREHRIDYAGAALLTIALTALLLAILEGGVAWEWTSPISLGLFGFTALVVVAFVLVERRAAEPVLPVRVITRRIVLTTSLNAAVVGVVLIGITSFAPTYLQTSAGADPLVAGLAVAALTLGWPIASTLSGRLYLRIGFRSTILIGALVVTLACAFLAVVAPWPNIVVLAIGCLVVGFGLGFVAAPSLIVAQSSVPWNERGVVTGLSAFLRTLGSTIGVALLGSIANASIAAQGGDETDPATITAASTLVFIAVAVAAAFLLLTASLMPRTPRPGEAAVRDADTAPL